MCKIALSTAQCYTTLTLMMYNKLLWFIQDLLILTKSVLPVKQMVIMDNETVKGMLGVYT